MVSVTAQTFLEVDLLVLAQQSGEATFVKLTNGRLQVDENFNSSLHPTSESTVPPPMPLGVLCKASAVPGDDNGRCLDVQTNRRGMVSVYRLVFRSTRDAQGVAELAEKAMQREFRSWAEVAAARSSENDDFLAAVRRTLGECRPLLFNGVQFFGADPNQIAGEEDYEDAEADEEGSEVLLGEGVLALLDPNWQTDNIKRTAAANSIGEYELLFFTQEEGAQTPLRRFPIGPKMTLRVQEREKAELDDEEEAAMSLSLSIFGDIFTIAFDSVDVAQAFERDFTVRQRLMAVASSTAKKTNEVAKLQKSPLRMRLERVVPIGLAIPAVALFLASQSQAVGSATCNMFCQ